MSEVEPMVLCLHGLGHDEVKREARRMVERMSDEQVTNMAAAVCAATIVAFAVGEADLTDEGRAVRPLLLELMGAGGFNIHAVVRKEKGGGRL